jgi:ABC-type xylose transport system permease subunit
MVKSEFASDVTWERVLSIWWAFVWRTVIYGMLLGLVLGFIGGFIVAAIGRPDLAATVGAFLGWLGSVPVSIVVMSIALKKRYAAFSIRLSPHGAAG